MYKPYPKILAIFMLLPVIFALINTGIFGYQGLTAYFGFTIFAPVAMIIAAVTGFSGEKSAIPLPVRIFLILTLYILLHGWSTGTANLTHYYWFCACLFILSMAVREVDTHTVSLQFICLEYIAALEALLVLLQGLNIIPSKNEFFSCTGTWQNPNVTAIFLALCLFPIGKSMEIAQKRNRRVISNLTGILVLTAIMLLKSRTAIIVSAMLILGHFWENGKVSGKTSSFIHANKKLLIIPAILIIGGLACWLAFGFKTVSTHSRLEIWKNSFGLMAQKPMTGQGFGLFEKSYNLYVAQNNLPANDHINMPYNDFLELGIEGGFIAVLLWSAFLISLAFYRYKRKYSLLPILAWLIIELLNFGFQAIPAFALFLYLALLPDIASRKEVKGEMQIPRYDNKIQKKQTALINRTKSVKMYGAAIVGISLILLIHQARYADALYQTNILNKDLIVENSNTSEPVDKFEDLSNTAGSSEFFLRSYGNAYEKTAQYRQALSQYLLAGKYCSTPALWQETAYCYEHLTLYDSAAYFLHLVENIQPGRLLPKADLLHLYLMKQDTVAAISKAKEIMNTPVKINSRKANAIKEYAENMLKKRP